ncbi:hypothetical protein HYS48_04560, partial [Candidatus Woesearchaeota archaeon]|nr:hypothetical protein [Candidatus Woesearchaeota archaeon]
MDVDKEKVTAQYFFDLEKRIHALLNPPAEQKEPMRAAPRVQQPAAPRKKNSQSWIVATIAPFLLGGLIFYGGGTLFSSRFNVGLGNVWSHVWNAPASAHYKRAGNLHHHARKMEMEERRGDLYCGEKIQQSKRRTEKCVPFYEEALKISHQKDGEDMPALRQRLHQTIAINTTCGSSNPSGCIAYYQHLKEAVVDNLPAFMENPDAFLLTHILHNHTQISNLEGVLRLTRQQHERETIIKLADVLEASSRRGGKSFYHDVNATDKLTALKFYDDLQLALYREDSNTENPVWKKMRVFWAIGKPELANQLPEVKAILAQQKREEERKEEAEVEQRKAQVILTTAVVPESKGIALERDADKLTYPYCDDRIEVSNVKAAIEKYRAALDAYRLENNQEKEREVREKLTTAHNDLAGCIIRTAYPYEFFPRTIEAIDIYKSGLSFLKLEDILHKRDFKHVEPLSSFLGRHTWKFLTEDTFKEGQGEHETKIYGLAREVKRKEHPTAKELRLLGDMSVVRAIEMLDSDWNWSSVESKVTEARNYYQRLIDGNYVAPDRAAAEKKLPLLPEFMEVARELKKNYPELLPWASALWFLDKPELVYSVPEVQRIKKIVQQRMEKEREQQYQVTLEQCLEQSDRTACYASIGQRFGVNEEGIREKVNQICFNRFLKEAKGLDANTNYLRCLGKNSSASAPENNKVVSLPT